MRFVIGLVSAVWLVLGGVGVARAEGAPKGVDDPQEEVEREEAPAPKIDPAKAADIRKLLELMGTRDVTAQLLPQMMAMLRKVAPEAPDEFWEEFGSQIRADELIELTIPIYARHLSHADVKELIRFYSSPAGRRFVKTLPTISSESMAAGQRWGELLARRAIRRIQERDTPARWK